MNDKSTVASNRLVTNKNFVPGGEEEKVIPARYLEENLIDLYKKFPLKDQVKNCSFRNYLKKSGVFKKQHRLTDLCDYCERLREVRPEIAKSMANYEFKISDEDGFNVDEVKQVLREKRDEFSENKENLNQVGLLKVNKKAQFLN